MYCGNAPTHNSVTVNNGAHSPTCSRRAATQPHRRPISIRDPCPNLRVQAQCSKLPRGAHTAATPAVDGRRSTADGIVCCRPNPRHKGNRQTRSLIHIKAPGSLSVQPSLLSSFPRAPRPLSSHLPMQTRLTPSHRPHAQARPNTTPRKSNQDTPRR